MGYNKIPLALRYNDTTNNAEGLIEFQLNLSDVGDVCSSTPSQGQGLVWSGGSDGSWCPSTLPAGGGGGTPTLPTGDPGDLLINTGGTTYLASAASDAGIMQLDPYFDANDEGAIAQWDGTKLEVVFPDQLYMLVEAGENLSKGDVVYVTGDTGSGRFIVAKADASDSNKMPAVGLVPAAISNGNNGKIVSFGRAIGLDTDGMTVGKPVYVATTAGGITKDKPTGATDLIQNIGIVSVVDATNGVIKVTGVGRSNDIPNNLDVVGSATIGTNEFTQTTANLANVDANHILISDSASATSSVASSTLFSNYYTQAQADAAFIEDVDNAVSPNNLNTSLSDGNLVRVNGSTFNDVSITPNSETFLGTNANLEDTTNVTAAPVVRDLLQYDGTYWQPRTLSEVQTNSDAAGRIDLGGLGDVNDSDNPPLDIPDAQTVLYDRSTGSYVVSALKHSTLSGLGDDDHTQYVLSAGTRSMSALTVNNEINTKDIEVTRLGPSRPTCITHFSDWLSLDVRNNGYSPSLAGGASHVQDSNLVTMNTTEYGIGVLRLKTSTSVTNSQSRVMTYDSTVAPSTCGVSFAARVCPSGAWTTGVNEGVITMGIHNRSNSSNLHPNAGAWFQYDHSSSNWQAITGWFTVSSNTDTGISATPESFQVLQIKIDENWQTFDFYIDGSSVATHLISTHNVPTSSRYGFTLSVRNGSLAGPGSFTSGGNELFLDWDYRKITHTATDRGESYIQ